MPSSTTHRQLENSGECNQEGVFACWCPWITKKSYFCCASSVQRCHGLVGVPQAQRASLGISRGFYYSRTMCQGSPELLKANSHLYFFYHFFEEENSSEICASLWLIFQTFTAVMAKNHMENKFLAFFSLLLDDISMGSSLF